MNFGGFNNNFGGFNNNNNFVGGSFGGAYKNTGYTSSKVAPYTSPFNGNPNPPSFNISHFQGIGNNTRDFGGSIGGNFTTSKTSGGTSATFGAERHGQLFGTHNVSIGSASINQQHSQNINSFVGGSVGSNGVENTVKAGVKFNF